DQRLANRDSALVGVDQECFEQCDGVHYGLLCSRSWSSFRLMRCSSSRVSLTWLSSTAIRSPSFCTERIVVPATPRTVVLTKPMSHQESSPFAPLPFA